MHYPQDPDSSSEEDSISIEEPSKERTFLYEEDIFEESQDETMLSPPLYLEESISESIEYAEDEMESMSRDLLSPFHSSDSEDSSKAD
ncbi:MAG: hypothetical protein CL916_15025 [Deltaproteobacteria bacterium]|nr:hypothetical protein [Deltaproteobacteria bacterium]